MNKLDVDYQSLLTDILENGIEKKDRTGTGTLSVFGRQIRHKMTDGFPLLTTKKMAFKSIVTELLWFLKGDTSIKYLVDNGCHIWDGDAYANYLKKRTTANKDNIRIPHTLENGMTGQISRPLTKDEFINKIKTDDEFAKRFGNLGPIYGKQWRKWDTKPTTNSETGEIFIGNSWVDQIQNLINELKTNPDSRRLKVNSWNVGELDQMVLPPCHYSFQVYTRELSNKELIELAFKSIESTDGISAAFLWELSCQGKKESEIIESVSNSLRNIPKRSISLMFNMRSTDVGLGLGFNLASYGLLLMMISKQVNMIPDELIYNGGDVHLYKNHIEPIKEQLDREPYPLPNVKISDRVVNDIADYTLDDIVLENYQSHPTIKMPLSN
jgi:thymidylate synthase